MCLFEWDENKERANWRKHGILFEDAASVFDDPYRLAEQDDRYDYGETRWWTIGMIQGRCMMLFVVYTTRNDGTETIRIISARHADPHERRLYGNRKI
jgi:uncharacterized DUF497 family protein